MPAASGHMGGQGFLVQVEERDDERAAEGRVEDSVQKGCKNDKLKMPSCSK